MYKAGSIYSYKTVWALKFGEKEKVFITISISSAMIVPVKFPFVNRPTLQSHIFPINPFISYGISQLFAYSCSYNSLMKYKLLSYLWLFYMHLLPLFLDRSHQRLVYLFDLFKELIFGFLNQLFFSIPLLLISTLSYYFNPSHFTGPENIWSEWYQFLEIWYWCSDP